MNKTVKGFRQETYVETVEKISTLRANLPEETTISLAREVLLRVAAHAAPDGALAVLVDDADIEELAKALIATDPDAGSTFVDHLRGKGVSIESVYLNYLACAARKLGEWWENDTVNLLDVTVGTGRIYAIMRAMADLFEPASVPSRKSAVLAAVPDETHTLGVRMAADLFRKQGWDIDLKIGRTHQDLVDEISKSSHVLIGLSGGGQHAFSNLSRLILALRISNPKAYILVSGNIVNEMPEMINLLGVDAMPADFDGAVAEMTRLWDQAQGRDAL